MTKAKFQIGDIVEIINLPNNPNTKSKYSVGNRYYIAHFSDIHEHRTEPYYWLSNSEDTTGNIIFEESQLMIYKKNEEPKSNI